MYRTCPCNTGLGLADVMGTVDPTPPGAQTLTTPAPSEKSVLDTVLTVVTFFQVVKLLDGFDV